MRQGGSQWPRGDPSCPRDAAVSAAAKAPGTPQNIVDLLRKVTATALSDAKIRAQLALHGVEPGDNLDVRTFLVSEREKFGRAVRDPGIAGD